MEREKIIIKVISAVQSFYERQKSFKTTFPNQHLITKAMEVFDDDLDVMIDSILDLIGVPDNEETNDRYDKRNWTRSVCTNIIQLAASHPKFKKPAAELISYWENLGSYTSKVETHTWFYYTELLEEHLNGYKKWNKNQKEEKKKKNE